MLYINVILCNYVKYINYYIKYKTINKIYSMSFSFKFTFYVNLNIIQVWNSCRIVINVTIVLACERKLELGGIQKKL